MYEYLKKKKNYINKYNPAIQQKISYFADPPMALRAWLSSRLNALIGTSSHTGNTATVERLLAGLVTSALAVILGRLRAEPGSQDHSD